MIPRMTSNRRCSVITIAAAVVVLIAITTRLPTGTQASAIRSVSEQRSENEETGITRYRRDADPETRTLVRNKRTLHKLKPLLLLPARIALGAGSKLAAGARLGAKAVHVGSTAVHVGSKALSVGLVGLRAVKKVARVTVKAATALGVKAVLLNFLFQKINQVIDFKTRLLSNLDQRNKQQNAQFLSPVISSGPSASKPNSGSIGNKDDDDFLASAPSDQQVLAQEQSQVVAVAPSVDISPLDDDEVTFDPKKVSLQVPDRLFGPSFTAVNGISLTIGNVIQKAAGRLARLVDAIKAAIFRKVAGVSSLSNSSGSFAGKGDSSQAASEARGSRDAVASLSADGLDPDPLDSVSSSPDKSASNKRNADTEATTKSN